MPFIIVSLDCQPIIFAAPVVKWRRGLWNAQLAALDGFDPSRVRKAERVATLNESVTQLKVPLNRRPVIPPSAIPMLCHLGKDNCQPCQPPGTSVVDTAPISWNE